MHTFITLAKAVVTRVLFATHAFMAVWVLVHIRGRRDVYWYLLAPLMFQGFEGIVSICARNGEEMKWFCPSVFLYLVSVVPPIWLMELALNDIRIHPIQALNATHALSHAHIQVLGKRLESEDCVRVLEQMLLVMLLMGRWLLPKGKLTREQLSQLLLAYMAMAADIIELFECFKEDTVTKNIELIYATLAIWSWSLLQFTLVLSATYAPKPRPSINYPPPQEVTMDDTALITYCDADGKSTKTTCTYNVNIFLDMDIIAILTTVFMQDGPFFLLRMTLIFGYKVVSYLNIFFTCKNTLVVSLQLYRLFVLCSRKSVLNKKRKELLHHQNSQTDECSDESECSEDETADTNSSHDNPPPTPPPSIAEMSPPTTPPPPLHPLLPPQPTDFSTDPKLEESLMEIIEHLGEENVLRELENLVTLPPNEGLQEGTSMMSLRDVTQAVQTQPSPSLKVGDDYPEDDYSPPDSGIQNSSSLPLNSRKTIKRHYSISKRNQDYLKCMQEGISGYCEGSDCVSYSDTDIPIDNYNPDQSSMSVSSNSLQVDPSTDSRQHGWGLIRDRYFPSRQPSQAGSREFSISSSLQRGTRRSFQSSKYPVLPHQNSRSPVPQCRVRQGSSQGMQGRGGSLRASHRGSNKGTTLNDLRRHTSVNIYDHIPAMYSGISESDADTLETTV